MGVAFWEVREWVLQEGYPESALVVFGIGGSVQWNLSVPVDLLCWLVVAAGVGGYLDRLQVSVFRPHPLGLVLHRVELSPVEQFRELSHITNYVSYLAV